VRRNQGHRAHVEQLVEMSDFDGEFEDYFPESASGELEDEQDQYFVRDVVWIGDKGKMVRADPDYMQHIWGNIFDENKVAAVAMAVRQHPKRIYFYAPYGTASRIDLQAVKESIEYAEDEGLDRPYTTGDDELDEYLADPETHLDAYGAPGDEEYDEEKRDMDAQLKQAVEDGDGDLGEWVVTVRDGNHRAFGAILGGEPYVYVRLEDNQYQDLMHAKKKGTLTEEQAELLEMLD
jgi:hypothetical protein